MSAAGEAAVRAILGTAVAERQAGFQPTPEVRLLLAIFGHDKGALRRARKLAAALREQQKARQGELR